MSNAGREREKLVGQAQCFNGINVQMRIVEHSHPILRYGKLIKTTNKELNESHPKMSIW